MESDNNSGNTNRTGGSDNIVYHPPPQEVSTALIGDLVYLSMDRNDPNINDNRENRKRESLTKYLEEKNNESERRGVRPLVRSSILDFPAVSEPMSIMPINPTANMNERAPVNDPGEFSNKKIVNRKNGCKRSYPKYKRDWPLDLSPKKKRRIESSKSKPGKMVVPRSAKRSGKDPSLSSNNSDRPWVGDYQLQPLFSTPFPVFDGFPSFLRPEKPSTSQDGFVKGSYPALYDRIPGSDCFQTARPVAATLPFHAPLQTALMPNSLPVVPYRDSVIQGFQPMIAVGSRNCNFNTGPMDIPSSSKFVPWNYIPSSNDGISLDSFKLAGFEQTPNSPSSVQNKPVPNVEGLSEAGRNYFLNDGSIRISSPLASVPLNNFPDFNGRPANDGRVSVQSRLPSTVTVINPVISSRRKYFLNPSDKHLRNLPSSSHGKSNRSVSYTKRGPGNRSSTIVSSDILTPSTSVDWNVVSPSNNSTASKYFADSYISGRTDLASASFKNINNNDIYSFGNYSLKPAGPQKPQNLPTSLHNSFDRPLKPTNLEPLNYLPTSSLNSSQRPHSRLPYDSRFQKNTPCSSREEDSLQPVRAETPRHLSLSHQINSSASSLVGQRCNSVFQSNKHISDLGSLSMTPVRAEPPKTLPSASQTRSDSLNEQCRPKGADSKILHSIRNIIKSKHQPDNIERKIPKTMKDSSPKVKPLNQSHSGRNTKRSIFEPFVDPETLDLPDLPPFSFELKKLVGCEYPYQNTGDSDPRPFPFPDFPPPPELNKTIIDWRYTEGAGASNRRCQSTQFPEIENNPHDDLTVDNINNVQLRKSVENNNFGFCSRSVNPIFPPPPPYEDVSCRHSDDDILDVETAAPEPPDENVLCRMSGDEMVEEETFSCAEASSCNLPLKKRKF